MSSGDAAQLHAACRPPLPLLVPRRGRWDRALPSGRMLLIANHAGQLPFDAAMLMCASILEAELPRVLRGMAEYWMPTLPSSETDRTPHRIRRRNAEELRRPAEPRGGRDRRSPKACAQPQAVRAALPPAALRAPFMRLALETRTPIVPAVVIGLGTRRRRSRTSAARAPMGAGVSHHADLSAARPARRAAVAGQVPDLIGSPMHFGGNPRDEGIRDQARSGGPRRDARHDRARLRTRRSVFF